MCLQEGCRRRDYILRSSALRQAKGPTIHERDHGDGSVDVADAIYCHCLLQIILRLRVRIGRGALPKIVLASKLPDLCIDLSRRKPQNEYHYQSESNEGHVLQLRYSTLVSPASLSRFRTNLRQLRHIGHIADLAEAARLVPDDPIPRAPPLPSRSRSLLSGRWRRHEQAHLNSACADF